jgi:hypothetical protein
LVVTTNSHHPQPPGDLPSLPVQLTVSAAGVTHSVHFRSGDYLDTPVDLFIV